MHTRRNFTRLTLASAVVVAAAGTQVQAQTLRVRRNVMEMPPTDPFFATYAKAVRAMHALPVTDGRHWINQARIHPDHCEHGSLGFLHWHRHYLCFFEKICAELSSDPSFSLPYWDWSKGLGEIPTPFYDVDELNVTFWKDAGKYNGASWGPVNTQPRRGLTKGTGVQKISPVFSPKAIERILSQSDPYIFAGSLEGNPHNSGHGIVGSGGGHMGDGLSPLDPIFWLHHCNVDRIWADWQSFGNQTPDVEADYANNFVEEKAGEKVASVKSANAMTTQGLGYTYDTVKGISPTSVNKGTFLIERLDPKVLESIIVQDSPMILGSTNRAITVRGGVPISIDVPLTGFSGELKKDRLFRTKSNSSGFAFALETRRFVAKLSKVKPPEGVLDFLVNVYINCPYLSVSTPTTDIHYAGTFAFFVGPEHRSHEQTFYIDVTDPVRELLQRESLNLEQMKVQLLTLPASENRKVKAVFTVGKIEVVSV